MMDVFSQQEMRKELIEVFEEVKEAVKKSEGRSRAGLMLGLQELGTQPKGFIGGYYPVGSNLIVLNKSPIYRINETDPNLFKPYSFHVLLHEYIHSLGVVDEGVTRRKTYEISRDVYGEEHLVTEFSRDLGKFIPNLVYPDYGWIPEHPSPIELVRGFDRSSTNYIA